MRWCFDAGAHPYADHVLERLETGTGEAFVPVLWRYEVRSVLARGQIRGFLPAVKSKTFLDSLTDLAINVDADSAGNVLTSVHALALQYRLTSYDAAYLELAQRRNLPLATLDDELREACQAAGVTVL